MNDKEEYRFIEGASRVVQSIREIEYAFKVMNDKYRENLDKFYEFVNEFDYYLCALLDKEMPDEDESKPCYVYYILNQEKDKVKIGVSSNPIGRAKDLQTASGEDIEIYHTIEFKNRNEAYEAESFLHKRFSEYRKKPTKVSKSCEWFDSEILLILMPFFHSAEQIQCAMERKKEDNRKAMEGLKIIC